MSYISAAIVTFDSTDLYALTEEHTGNLVSIIASNIQTNPIVRQFQTMFERFGDDFTLLTVIPSRVIADMLRDQVDRSPIVYTFTVPRPPSSTLSLLIPLGWLPGQVLSGHACGDDRFIPSEGSGLHG